MLFKKRLVDVLGVYKYQKSEKYTFIGILREIYLFLFNKSFVWDYISRSECLTEDFMDRYADELNWDYLSQLQMLSEPFIEKYKNKVNWIYISSCQELSEKFIEKFDMLLSWSALSENQTLSEEFLEKHSVRIDLDLYRAVHKEYSLEEKFEMVKKYAEEWDLKFDGSGYLYAFRNHDELGRGRYNTTTRYEKGRVYRDWKCDMRKDVPNSFGFGIFPSGNTPIRVHYSNFGVVVDNNFWIFADKSGKCRVWEFEVL